MVRHISLPTTGAERIHDVEVIDERYLIAVGQVTSTQQAVIRVFDLQDGQQIGHRIMSTEGLPNGFLGVTEAPDASIYAVGFQLKNKKERQPWWVRFDESLDPIASEVLEMSGHNYFQKISWNDEGGLIAGWKASDKKAKLWLSNISGNQLGEVDVQIGKDNFKDLVGMHIGRNNQTWLTGNSLKGDIWFYLINSNGEVLRNLELANGHFDELNCSAIAHNGNLLFGGERWGAEQSYNQAFAGQIHFDDFSIEEKIIPNAISNYVAGMKASPDFDIQVVLQTKSLKEHRLVPYPGSVQKAFDLEIDPNLGFKTILFGQNQTDDWYVLGNIYKNNKIASNLHLSIFNPSALTKETDPRSKSMSFNLLPEELEASQPILEDENKDGKLSDGERGAVTFYLKNNSTTKDLKKIEAWVKDNCLGIEFLKRNRFIPFLPRGSQKKVSIPIRKVGIMNTGTFDIVIQVDGEPVFEFKAVIDDELMLPSANRNSNTPRLFNPGTRERTTTEGTYIVEFFLFSNTKIRANDIKIFRNKKPLVDGKNIPELIQIEDNPEALKYILRYKVFDLEQGRNVIEVAVKDEQTDMIIDYIPEKPNLHLVAIGPAYPDLRYTTKDAKDFAELILTNADHGLFQKIKTVDTLFQAYNTTQKQIERVFAQLEKHYKSGHIQEHDFLFIYISAHGIELEDGYRILPSDYDPHYLEPTTVHYQNDLLKYLNRIECKKFIFIDACLSGYIDGAKALNIKSLNDAIIKANQSVAGVAAFSSSAKDQLSYEYPPGENGLFTEALLEALSGKADQLNEGSNYILSLQEIMDYLTKRVPELSKEMGFSEAQTPYFVGDLPMDLPLMIRK